MLLSIIIAITLGLVTGIVTGITPGLHVNTVTAILISSTVIISSIDSLSLILFIVVLAAAHSTIDFVPSIFLGAPDEESFLATLPGHEMLQKGKATEAVILTLLGAVSAIPLMIIITPIFVIAIPLIIEALGKAIPFVLIYLTIYTICREKYIVAGFAVAGLAGLLGYAALNLPIREPLLPLLSGLFGGSGLLLSALQKTKIPKQQNTSWKKIKISRKEYLQATISAGIAAPLCSFLPAIGSGTAATLSTEIVPQSRKGFLITIGAINLLVNILSFATVYSIGKARTGAAVAVQKIAGEIKIKELVIILGASITTIIISVFIAVFLAKKFVKIMRVVKYSLISGIMLAIVTVIVVIISGLTGLVVFATGTTIGIFTILSGVRRINLMACLFMPTILLYLF